MFEGFSYFTKSCYLLSYRFCLNFTVFLLELMETLEFYNCFGTLNVVKLSIFL